jgi:uncharacterized protein (DUF736 family)
MKKKQNNHGGKRVGAGRKSSNQDANDYISIIVKKSLILAKGGKLIVKQLLEKMLEKME